MFFLYILEFAFDYRCWVSRSIPYHESVYFWRAVFYFPLITAPYLRTTPSFQFSRCVFRLDRFLPFTKLHGLTDGIPPPYLFLHLYLNQLFLSSLFFTSTFIDLSPKDPRTFDPQKGCMHALDFISIFSSSLCQ